ncbi:hypothetical protein Acid7E03_08980 [Acidisoma sp. 7E03]
MVNGRVKAVAQAPSQPAAAAAPESAGAKVGTSGCDIAAVFKESREMWMHALVSGTARAPEWQAGGQPLPFRLQCRA